jgi:hypothetical protein
VILTSDLGVEQVYEEGQLVGARLITTRGNVENGTMILTQDIGSVFLFLPGGHIALRLAQTGKLVQPVRQLLRVHLRTIGLG